MTEIHITDPSPFEEDYIVEKIKTVPDFTHGFDVRTEKYTDMIMQGIIDPQKVTAGNVVVDIEKAIEYSFDNIDVCNRFLKLANLKLKTLQKSWGTR